MTRGYMAMREEADRALWWREFRRDVAVIALFGVFIAALACWVISPMPPVVP